MVSKIVGSLMAIAFVAMFSYFPFNIPGLGTVLPWLAVVFNACGGFFILREIWR